MLPPWCAAPAGGAGRHACPFAESGLADPCCGAPCRDRPQLPFRCLDGQYRRELVRVYLANVEGIARRFVEEKKEYLQRLLEEGRGFKQFWRRLKPERQRQLAAAPAPAVLKVRPLWPARLGRPRRGSPAGPRRSPGRRPGAGQAAEQASAGRRATPRCPACWLWLGPGVPPGLPAGSAGPSTWPYWRQSRRSAPRFSSTLIPNENWRVRWPAGRGQALLQ